MQDAKEVFLAADREAHLHAESTAEHRGPVGWGQRAKGVKGVRTDGTKAAAKASMPVPPDGRQPAIAPFRPSRVFHSQMSQLQ